MYLDTVASDFTSEFQQFFVYPGRTPQRVGVTHSSNQVADFGIDVWAPAAMALPTPVILKALSVPPNHRSWLYEM